MESGVTTSLTVAGAGSSSPMVSRTPLTGSPGSGFSPRTATVSAPSSNVSWTGVRVRVVLALNWPAGMVRAGVSQTAV